MTFRRSESRNLSPENGDSGKALVWVCTKGNTKVKEGTGVRAEAAGPKDGKELPDRSIPRIAEERKNSSSVFRSPWTDVRRRKIGYLYCNKRGRLYTL